MYLKEWSALLSCCSNPRERAATMFYRRLGKLEILPDLSGKHNLIVRLCADLIGDRVK
jgi:hypothetical protein